MSKRRIQLIYFLLFTLFLSTVAPLAGGLWDQTKMGMLCDEETPHEEKFKLVVVKFAVEFSHFPNDLNLNQEKSEMTHYLSCIKQSDFSFNHTPPPERL